MFVQAMKTRAKSAVAQLCHASGIGLRVSRGKVAILAYHRVVTPEHLQRHYIEPGMYVLQDVFEMQVRWLINHYNVISFSELLDKWHTGTWDPKQAYCVLTFDDGWLDNYQYAFPVLRDYKVPATIFLPTSFVGSSSWFWADHLTYLLSRLSRPNVTPMHRSRVAHVIADFPGSGQENRARREIDLSQESFADIIARCKCLKPGEIDAVLKTLGDILEVPIPRERLTVNWEEVREMAMHGISFGSHSCSHHLLTQLSHPEARREIEESDRVLRAMPGGYLPVFCYPNGDHNETIQQIVQECNYAAAVSTQTGLEVAQPDNRFSLKRIGIHNDVSSTVSMFAFHLFRAALRV